VLACIWRGSPAPASCQFGMLTQSLPECRWVFSRRNNRSILTPEIISRLRVIFLFYKTLHFPLDPVSDPGTPRAEMEAGRGLSEGDRKSK
jgi:hypothetical protein